MPGDKHRGSHKFDILRWAADRAAHDPTFLGSDIADFAMSAQLDAEGLAAYLSCKASAMPKLRLCLRPNPISEHFLTDVAKIAEYTGASSDQLIALIRHVDALRALRCFRGTKTQQNSGVMMAARRGDQPSANETIRNRSARRNELWNFGCARLRNRSGAVPDIRFFIHETSSVRLRGLCRRP